MNKEEEKILIAHKVIEFFKARGLSDEQKQLIISKVASCDDEKLEVWRDFATKIDNQDVRIIGTINKLRERRFSRIRDWKKRVVANKGLGINLDGLTSSISDFLDKELEELFGE